MQISTFAPYTPPRRSAEPTPTPGPEPARDSVSLQTPAPQPEPAPAPAPPQNHKKPASLKTYLRRAAKGAAFLGIPAALGSAGTARFGIPGAFLGGVAAESYGLVHGGLLGWDIVPGKQAGGALLAVATVPFGAIGGAFTAAGMSLIGSAAGLPGVIGCATAGAALGAFTAYDVGEGGVFD